MAQEHHIDERGGGHPINWKSVINHPDGWIPGEREQIEWTGDSGLRRHLVDDAGIPLTPQQVTELKPNIMLRNRRAREAAEQAAEHADQVAQGAHPAVASHSRPFATRRGASERRGAGFITYGIVFWLFLVIVSIGNGMSAGSIVVLVLAAPVIVPFTGIVAKAFFGMLGIAMRS